LGFGRVRCHTVTCALSHKHKQTNTNKRTHTHAHTNAKIPKEIEMKTISPGTRGTGGQPSTAAHATVTTSSPAVAGSRSKTSSAHGLAVVVPSGKGLMATVTDVAGTVTEV